MTHSLSWYTAQMKTKFILFDFDGVVADSFEVSFETGKVLCPMITEGQYRKRFEGNINEVLHLEDFHTQECRHDLKWFDIYVPKMKEKVKIFSGMKDVILELEKDYTLIVISSTISFPIEDFLDSHELRSHFDWVMGNDVHKSKVEKIKMVFEKYGVGPQDCVFITDTLGDMHEAEKMQVPSIGVTWGFCTPETLQKGTYLKLVDTPEELRSTINEHFSS